MSLSQENLEAIVVSVLAVNSYGIERVYGLLPKFRENGLLNPTKISNADVSQVMMDLYKAGYDRGMLTEMMAGRLVGVLKAVAEGRLDMLNELVEKGSKTMAKDLLCQVKGIGPRVASDVWMLVTSREIQGGHL